MMLLVRAVQTKAWTPKTPRVQAFGCASIITDYMFTVNTSSNNLIPTTRFPCTGAVSAPSAISAPDHNINSLENHSNILPLRNFRLLTYQHSKTIQEANMITVDTLNKLS
jgi:hypothetical protein